MAELPTATSTPEPSTADASAGTAATSAPPWPRARDAKLKRLQEQTTPEAQQAARIRHVRKHSSPQFQLKKATYMLGRELTTLRKKQIAPGLTNEDRRVLKGVAETLAYLAKLEQQLEKAKVRELATMTTEEVIEKLRVIKYRKGPENRELAKEMEPDATEDDDDDGTKDS
jgi:hypothetical protein